jgi:hypothetical protein
MNAFERNCLPSKPEDLEAVIAALAQRGSGALAVGAVRARPARYAGGQLIRSRIWQMFRWTQRLTAEDFNGHRWVWSCVPIIRSETEDGGIAAASRRQRRLGRTRIASTRAGRILDQHFAEAYPVMQAWSQHNRRMCARQVIATMEAARRVIPDAARSC